MKLFNPIRLLLLLAVCSNSSAQIITTMAGTGPYAYTGDGGPATSATFNFPCYAVARGGNTYVCDNANHCIRKISATGVISTLAGTGVAGYGGDGGPASAALLQNPNFIAFDNAGNLFFTDRGNYRVRKIDAAGIITTVAGNGTHSDAGDGGPATAASLDMPAGIAIDGANNIYVASWMSSVVRKITASGYITTFAGNYSLGYSGDGGPATAAQLKDPHGLAVDGAGNLYIGDSYNYTVRKVTPAGTITTVAGTGVNGSGGDGGPATAASFGPIAGVAIDITGRLFITDQYNNKIRMVDATGTVTTIAGNGAFAFSGDGGPATAAALFEPFGVSIDATGNILIADFHNSRVRSMRMPILGEVSSTKDLAKKTGPALKVWPQPCDGSFTLRIAAETPGNATVTIADVTGKRMKELTTETNRDMRINAELPAGAYILTAHTDQWNESVWIEVK